MQQIQERMGYTMGKVSTLRPGSVNCLIRKAFHRRSCHSYLLSPPKSHTTAAHKKTPKALKINASGAFFIHSYQ